MHRLNFGALKKSVAVAVSTAAHGARDLASEAKEALERALVAKCLRPYVVKEQTATAGPNGLWKIYAADARQPGTRCANELARKQRRSVLGGHCPSVSVWVLDKKFLQDPLKARNRAWEPFLDQQRAHCALLLKMKHPGILKVVEPLEETRTQFVMVTEPIFCSLSDWISRFASVPGVAESVRDVSFSELEIKHGLLQVAAALSFLHTDVNRAHSGISPESVLVCADGHWALSNFAFSAGIEFTGSKPVRSFDYTDLQPALEQLASKPRLQYVAPELATAYGENTSASLTPAADVFSFGLLVCACLARLDLLAAVGDDIGKYKTRLATISHRDLAGLPPQLQPIIQSTLSSSPSDRPALSAVTTCAYFQDDRLLRALQFLEGMVGKGPMQKASFLNDLNQFWTQFDELQNENLQSLLIPFIFKAAGRQDQEEFLTYTLPQLIPMLQAIKGEALLTVLGHCDCVTKQMPRASVADVLLPIFLRAFDQSNLKIQEEALKKARSVFECLDYQQLKSEVLPRVHVLSMKTVSAKVRINCLVLMSHLIPRVDKDEARKMLHSCRQITKVDKSPGTLMCVLGLGDAISKHWGAEMTAEVVLPFLTPLLVGKTLNHQQFGTFLTVVRDMIGQIEEKVGKQIMELEPVTLEKSEMQQTALEVAWDTKKPKDVPGNASDAVGSWKETNFGNLLEQQTAVSSLTSPPAIDVTFANSAPRRPPIVHDFFDFGQKHRTMEGNGQMSNPQPISTHAPQMTPPILDAMDFGMDFGIVENTSSGYAAPLDSLANVAVDYSAQTQTAPTVQQTSDPFQNFAAPLRQPPLQTQTPMSKSNDPFADLLD